MNMKITIKPTDGTKFIKDIMLALYPNSMDNVKDDDRVQLMNFDATKDLYVAIGRDLTVFGDGIPVRAQHGESFTLREFKKMKGLTSSDNSNIEVSIRNTSDLKLIL